MKIHAHVPYYNAYEYVPSWFNSHLFEWAGNATEFEANQPVMDIVTAPNNPDGAMRNKSIPGEASAESALDIGDICWWTGRLSSWCISCQHLSMLSAQDSFGIACLSCWLTTSSWFHSNDLIKFF